MQKKGKNHFHCFNNCSNNTVANNIRIIYFLYAFSLALPLLLLLPFCFHQHAKISHTDTHSGAQRVAYHLSPFIIRLFLLTHNSRVAARCFFFATIWILYSIHEHLQFFFLASVFFLLLLPSHTFFGCSFRLFLFFYFFFFFTLLKLYPLPTTRAHIHTVFLYHTIFRFAFTR